LYKGLKKELLSQTSSTQLFQQTKRILDDFIIHLDIQNSHLKSITIEKDEELNFQAKEIEKLKEKLEESEASLRRESDRRKKERAHEEFVLEARLKRLNDQQPPTIHDEEQHMNDPSPHTDDEDYEEG